MTRRTDVFFWDPSASTHPNQWPTRVYSKTNGDDAVRRTSAMPTLQVIMALVRGNLDLHPDMPRLVLPASYAPVAWPASPSASMTSRRLALRRPSCETPAGRWLPPSESTPIGRKARAGCASR